MMQTNPPRRPGELLFNAFVVAASLFLFYTAYGISGFEGLSAPGTLPMVTTGLMTICASMILLESLRKSGTTGETLERDILPMVVVATIAAVTAYAVLLKPLGFLPTSFLFLLGLIQLFSRRGWAFSALASLASVALIYVVFRLIFSVLMPQGVIPESEIMAWLSTLFGEVK